MQSRQEYTGTKTFRDAACVASPVFASSPQRGCYGVQVLVAGRNKRWRDDISAEIRRAGFCATTVDSAVDALTVLVLGIPVDLLVTDADLRGTLDSAQLAAEARALRPNLGIVLACDGRLPGSRDTIQPDVILMPRHGDEMSLAATLREALSLRA